MPLWLKIYLWGYLVSFIICIAIERDEDGNISVPELIASMIVALLSWLSALALWVGWNIKHGHDKKGKDDID